VPDTFCPDWNPTMNLDPRQAEIAKYQRAYTFPDYRLGDRRRAHITEHLNRIPKGSLLDVSTGRGEVLDLAESLGHAPVVGTEAVPYLCDGSRVWHALAHCLPFGTDSFDTVTMFDVMEHLLRADTEAVCTELARVARRCVLLTIHNGMHRYRGVDLHINRRASYEAWHEELSHLFGPYHVVRHGAGQSISEMFEVLL
jgi:ubiquinone/menaquinone biosynthesis C-methylase UbiE